MWTPGFKSSAIFYRKNSRKLPKAKNLLDNLLVLKIEKFGHGGRYDVLTWKTCSNRVENEVTSIPFSRKCNLYAILNICNSSYFSFFWIFSSLFSFKYSIEVEKMGIQNCKSFHPTIWQSKICKYWIWGIC